MLDTDISLKDGSLEIPDTNVQGQIEFRNVSFKYPDAGDYVLENISFTAEAGQTVAIIGSTGSGKSTLINLVPRFYDVTEGEVLVDGVNVKKYTQKVLRNKLGYVSQRAVLFSGSVKSNVMYGDNGKNQLPEDMVEAVSIAQAYDFVEKMDGQYDACIAQGGTNVSGGQKQRLSIAVLFAAGLKFIFLMIHFRHWTTRPTVPCV